jgi:HSP20 family protein
MADITRWDPFRDLDSIQDELNRLFGRTFSGPEKARPGVMGGWVPALDVYETADEVVVSAELPGLDPKEVEVSVEDSTLTIRGQRQFEQETDEQNYHRIERRYGSFTRSIRLPQTADADKIQARFDKGVLKVEVPKREEAKPKRIEVKATA